MALKTCIPFKFMHKEIGIPFFLILLFLGGILLSCDDRTINPYEENQGVFSVYGALDMDEERHVIRVRNLLEPFQSDSTFPIDATVTFTNLLSGESTELRDSVIYFLENKVHNYMLPENLTPDTNYQITVQRSDGAKSQSTVRTPGLTEIKFHPKDSPNETTFFCETPIVFLYRNVHPPEYIRMEVGVLYQNEVHWAQIGIVSTLRYDPVLDAYRVLLSTRNLLVEIFPPILPDDIYFDPYLLMPTVSCDEIDERVITIRYTHYSREWSKGQNVKFGPILTDSDVVINGLGFVGAYRVDTYEVRFQEDPE